MRYLTVFLVIMCLFLGLSWWNSCIAWKKQLRVYSLNDSLLQKKVLDIRDSSGRQLQVYHLQTINSQQLAMSTSAEATQLRADLQKVHGKLSKVTSSVSIHTTTHDTLSIAIHDTIPDTGQVHISFLETPDSFLTLFGTANLSHIPGSLVFDSLNMVYSIHNRLSITHYREHKFLHKGTLNLLVTSDNPHTDIGKIQTYTVVVNRKWYQKWYTHVAIGAVVTLAAQHYLK